MEAGVGDLAAATLWEGEGFEDGGGGGVVERSVRDESGCRNCSAGSTVAGSVAAAGVFVTGEGGSTTGGAGGWAAADWLIV